MRLLFALGGNFLSATPDTERPRAALRALRADRARLDQAQPHPPLHGPRPLILPCLGRSESDLQAAGPQFVTVEDSMSCVHRSQGVLAPAGAALRSEPAIVAGLAAGGARRASRVAWAWLAEDYDRIRDDIAAVIPGFDDFNARVRAPDGFVLPNPVRERRFPTASGRAQFTVHPVPRARRSRPGSCC